MTTVGVLADAAQLLELHPTDHVIRPTPDGWKCVRPAHTAQPCATNWPRIKRNQSPLGDNTSMRARRLRPWPGTFRPVWVAVEMTGRSEKTIRTWVHNEKLASRKDAKTSELLVDLVQAVRLHETTPRRFRRIPGLAERAEEAAQSAEQEHRVAS